MVSPRSSDLSPIHSTMLSKRRKRSTIVCKVCKARKVRCDKNLPCASCVRHHTTHLCTYDESIQLKEELDSAVDSWHRLPSRSEDELDAVFLAPTTSLEVLSAFQRVEAVVGVNPMRLATEKVNFYEGYNCMQIRPMKMEESNQGPFAWDLMIRIDPGLGICIDYLAVADSPGQGTMDTPSELEASKAEPAQRKVLDRIRNHLRHKFDPRNMGLNFRNIPLGLTFNDPNFNKTNVGLEERFLGILPPKNIIWIHIDRFFRYIYPFCPYLDEKQFRSQVEQCIGRQSYDNSQVQKVVIDDLHFSYVGVLSIVLRLSYLLLISNNVQTNTNVVSLEPQTPEMAEIKMLLLFPIGIEYIDFARTCLNKYQMGSHSSMAIMQLFVFTRIYMELAPEDPDGPSICNYQVNNGVLRQMAYVIGLNRDPDKMEQFTCPREKHLRRKLWIFVQLRDLIDAVKFGQPFLLVAFTDTKFPVLDANNGNCETPGLDAQTSRGFHSLQQLIPLLRTLLASVLRMDEECTMLELVQNLDKLEIFVHKEYGTLRRFHKAFDEGEDPSVALLLPVFLPVHSFILMIYYRLFLRYEALGHPLAFFYLKKIYLSVALESLPFTLDLLERPHPYYRHVVHLMINPLLNYYLHRSIGCFITVVSRLGYQITRIRSLPPSVADKRTVYLKFLMRSLSLCSKMLLLTIQQINHRYCFCWRLGVTYTYVLRSLISEGFYEIPHSHDFKIPKIDFSEEQLLDLITILQAPLENVNLDTFDAYWWMVVDFVKKNKLARALLNPMESKLVYAGVPETLQDLEGSVVEGSASFEQPIDPSWSPMAEFQPDINNVMGSFFDNDMYFQGYGPASAAALDNGLQGAVST